MQNKTGWKTTHSIMGKGSLKPCPITGSKAAEQAQSDIKCTLGIELPSSILPRFRVGSVNDV